MPTIIIDEAEAQVIHAWRSHVASNLVHSTVAIWLKNCWDDEAMRTTLRLAETGVPVPHIPLDQQHAIVVVTASTDPVTGEQAPFIGALRHAYANTDTDTNAAWPWKVGGWVARGIIVNDLIHKGDQVATLGGVTGTVKTSRLDDRGETAGAALSSITPDRQEGRTSHTENMVLHAWAKMVDHRNVPVLAEVPLDELTAAQWREKWDALWKGLHDEAEERQWCEEYDDFAELHGGPERVVKYEARVEVQHVIPSHEADSLLGRYLLGDDESNVDVRNAIEVTHLVEVRVSMTPRKRGDSDAVDAAIEAELDRLNIGRDGGFSVLDIYDASY